MQEIPIGAITGKISTIKMVLSVIWMDTDIFPQYPQDRMANFFKVISRALGSRIEHQFTVRDPKNNEILLHNVWEKSFSDVRLQLNECLRICQLWREAYIDLTQNIWKQQGDTKSRQWEGKNYVDQYLNKLVKRMNEIFDIRSQHDELLRLLTKDEQEKYQVESLFNGFRNGQSFYISDSISDSWIFIKQKYESDLLKVEEQVCDKLRKEIF